MVSRERQHEFPRDGFRRDSLMFVQTWWIPARPCINYIFPDLYFSDNFAMYGPVYWKRSKIQVRLKYSWLLTFKRKPINSEGTILFFPAGSLTPSSPSTEKRASWASLRKFDSSLFGFSLSVGVLTWWSLYWWILWIRSQKTWSSTAVIPGRVC